MNQRQSKRLRRQAEKELLKWYSSLLELERGETVTMKQAIEYTPHVQYYEQQGTILVSQYTYRWFVLQEKKHGRHSRSPDHRWQISL